MHLLLAVNVKAIIKVSLKADSPAFFRFTKATFQFIATLFRCRPSFMLKFSVLDLTKKKPFVVEVKGLQKKLQGPGEDHPGEVTATKTIHIYLSSQV